MLTSRGGATSSSHHRGNAASRRVRGTAGRRGAASARAGASSKTDAKTTTGSSSSSSGSADAAPVKNTSNRQTSIRPTANAFVPKRAGPKLSAGDYNGRYQALKQAREQERKKAIADGFLADPDHPRSLAHAITPVGTCQDMCAEYERLERIVQQDVWSSERTTDRSGPDEERMVKKFRRAAAGLEEQLPSDLRPPHVLRRTIDFLFNDVLSAASSLEDVHYFIWDRTRAIRNDFSIQQVSRPEDLAIAVDCYERIARFHMLSLHQLSGVERPYDNYDPQQEREQLDKTLLSLLQYYDDYRGKVPMPNEAEFRAYSIIFQIQTATPDLEDRTQTWPRALLHSGRVQRALGLYALACNASEPQGPFRRQATPHPVAQADWAGFWALIRSNEISYLMACVAEIYFPYTRRLALNALLEAYKHGGKDRAGKPVINDDWSLDEVKHVLGLESADDVESLLIEVNLDVGKRADGTRFFDLHTASGKVQMPPVLPKSEIVERKRCNRTLTAVVNGMSVAAARKAGLVDDAAEDDSLFVPEGPSQQSSATPFGQSGFFSSAPNSFASIPSGFTSGQATSSPFGSASAEAGKKVHFADDTQGSNKTSTPGIFAGFGGTNPSSTTNATSIFSTSKSSPFTGFNNPTSSTSPFAGFNNAPVNTVPSTGSNNTASPFSSTTSTLASNDLQTPQQDESGKKQAEEQAAKEQKEAEERRRREQEAQEQAAREQAAREQASREAQERAAREQEQRVQAAREKALQEKIARERETARREAEARQAAERQRQEQERIVREREARISRTFDTVAEQLVYADAGLLDQYVEFRLGFLFQQARAQVDYEEAVRTADWHRNKTLRHRYGRLWREICVRRRLQRRGMERRRRAKLDAQRRANHSHAVGIAAELDDFRRRSSTSRDQSVSVDGSQASNKENEPNRFIPSGFRSGEQTAIRTSLLRSAASAASSQPHPRIPLTDSLIFNPVEDGVSLDDGNRGEPDHQGSLASSRSDSSFNRSVGDLQSVRSAYLPHNPLTSNLSASRIGHQHNTSKSSYFQLRAMGLDPNSSTLYPEHRLPQLERRLPQSERKRPRTSEVDIADAVPRKRAQTLNGSSLSSLTTTPAQPSFGPVATSVEDEEIKGPPVEAAEDDDDPVLAMARRARVAMQEGSSLFREAGRMLSSTPDRAVQRRTMSNGDSLQHQSQSTLSLHSSHEANHTSPPQRTSNLGASRSQAAVSRFLHRVSRDTRDRYASEAAAELAEEEARDAARRKARADKEMRDAEAAIELARQRQRTNHVRPPSSAVGDYLSPPSQTAPLTAVANSTGPSIDASQSGLPAVADSQSTPFSNTNSQSSHDRKTNGTQVAHNGNNILPRGQVQQVVEKSTQLQPKPRQQPDVAKQKQQQQQQFMKPPRPPPPRPAGNMFAALMDDADGDEQDSQECQGDDDDSHDSDPVEPDYHDGWSEVDEEEQAHEDDFYDLDHDSEPDDGLSSQRQPPPPPPAAHASSAWRAQQKGGTSIDDAIEL